MDIKLKLPFLGKSGEASPLLGPDSELLASLLKGKYARAVDRGRVFSQAATPLGLAIPIYTATALAGGMPLWNPPGSGVNVRPLFVSTAYASGTAAYTAVGLMARKNVGGPDLATGSQITAFAATTPENAIVGGGQASKIRSSNAGTVTVVAGVAAEWLRTLFGVNLEAQTGTAHATQHTTHDFEGSILLPPGTLAWLGATLASVALYASTIVWEEEPI